jgi:hypothetical protein
MMIERSANVSATLAMVAIAFAAANSDIASTEIDIADTKHHKLHSANARRVQSLENSSISNPAWRRDIRPCENPLDLFDSRHAMGQPSWYPRNHEVGRRIERKRTSPGQPLAKCLQRIQTTHLRAQLERPTVSLAQAVDVRLI